MIAHIRYLDGVKFEANVRGHVVRTDLEVASGGADASMSPPDLLLAALGTCAGYYAVQYLKVKGLPLADLTVEVTAEKAKDPARLGSFCILVHAPAGANADAVKRAVEKCLVHNTLAHAPSIETVVRVADAVRTEG